MRKLILVLIVISAAVNVQAGVLDVDYYKPSPAKALGNSIIIPGGGYLYLSEHNNKNSYEIKAIAFFVAGAASYLFMADQIRNGSAFFGVAAFAGVRLLEFNWVTENAERDRHQLYEKELRIKELDKDLNSPLPGYK